jgi:hypothetical protein
MPSIFEDRQWRKEASNAATKLADELTYADDAWRDKFQKMGFNVLGETTAPTLHGLEGAGSFVASVDLIDDINKVGVLLSQKDLPPEVRAAAEKYKATVIDKIKPDDWPMAMQGEIERAETKKALTQTGKSLQEWQKDPDVAARLLKNRPEEVKAFKDAVTQLAKGEVPVNPAALAKLVQRFGAETGAGELTSLVAGIQDKVKGLKEAMAAAASPASLASVDTGRASNVERSHSIMVSGENFSGSMDRTPGMPDNVRLAMAQAAKEVVQDRISLSNIDLVRNQVATKAVDKLRAEGAFRGEVDSLKAEKAVADKIKGAFDNAMEQSYAHMHDAIKEMAGKGDAMAKDTLAYMERPEIAGLAAKQRYQALANASGQLGEKGGTAASMEFEAFLKKANDQGAQLAGHVEPAADLGLLDAKKIAGYKLSLPEGMKLEEFAAKLGVEASALHVNGSDVTIAADAIKTAGTEASFLAKAARAGGKIVPLLGIAGAAAVAAVSGASAHEVVGAGLEAAVPGAGTNFSSWAAKNKADAALNIGESLAGGVTTLAGGATVVGLGGAELAGFSVPGVGQAAFVGYAGIQVIKAVAYAGGISNDPGQIGNAAIAVNNHLITQGADNLIRQATVPMGDTARLLLSKGVAGNPSVSEGLKTALIDARAPYGADLHDSLNHYTAFAKELATALTDKGPGGDAVRAAMKDQLNKAGVSPEQYAQALTDVGGKLDTVGTYAASIQSKPAQLYAAALLTKAGEVFGAPLAPSSAPDAGLDKLIQARGGKPCYNGMRSEAAQANADRPASKEPQEVADAAPAKQVPPKLAVPHYGRA